MKQYVKPVMECEAFVPNESIATCYAYIGQKTVISQYKSTDGKCDKDSDIGRWGNCANTWNGTGFEDDGFDELAGNEDIYDPVGGKGIYYSPSYAKATGHYFDLGGPFLGSVGTYGNSVKHHGKTHMASDAYRIKRETITVNNHKQYNCGPNAS